MGFQAEGATLIYSFVSAIAIINNNTFVVHVAAQRKEKISTMALFVHVRPFVYACLC